MKPAISNLSCGWGLPRSIIKSHQKKSGCVSEPGELCEIWSFFLNISATAEASDFKFGTQLGFAKAHHKTTPIGKSGCGLGLGELIKILGFPYNISAMAEASNFKIGIGWGFTKAHHKITHQRKVDADLGQRSSPKLWGSPLIFVRRLKLATSTLACSRCLRWPTIKPHPKEKVGVAIGLGSFQIYLGFSFNVSAMAALSA